MAAAAGPPRRAAVEMLRPTGTVTINPNQPIRALGLQPPGAGFTVRIPNIGNQLAIVNDNINSLVDIIKQKLGNDNQEVNTKVKDIVNRINGAMTNINNNMGYLERRFIDRNGDGEPIVQPNRNYLNPGVNAVFQNLHDYAKTNNPYRNTANANEAIVSFNNNAGVAKTIDLQNLDQNHVLTNIDTDNQKLINFGSVQDVQDLTNRLDNCQLLEMLYLIKHEELLKTFTFTLNLFDKYQYTIKLLLFVLKNLVYKTPGAPPPPPGAPRIQLPKALISNIKELLKDQQKMQEVLTQMQGVIDNNDIRDISLPLRQRPTSADLQQPGTNITNNTTPV
jgi:hypothetical protein